MFKTFQLSETTLKMRKHGFTNLDCLDACTQMLERAKNTGAYRNFIEAYLGKYHLPIESGKFM